MNQVKLKPQSKENITKHLRYRRWQKFVSVLSAVVVFCTTYALILPAITMESTYCGKEEHMHSIEAGCYTEHRTLVCGSEESEGEEAHTHSESCYTSERVLTCAQEEHEAHTHGDACYEPVRLIACRNAEADHVHTDECYHTPQVLDCTLPEDENHTHSDSCYKPEMMLVCGLEETEGHVHGDACYENQGEKVLSCGKEEGEGVPAHTHTAECYSVSYELTCEVEEHTHTLACYADPEADLETSEVWEQTFKDIKLTGNWAKDVLAIAESQLGYAESAKNYQVDASGQLMGYSRYGAWYGIPYGDWCDMFVSFVLKYAGIDQAYSPYSANVGVHIDKLSEMEQWHESYNAMSDAAREEVLLQLREEALAAYEAEHGPLPVGETEEEIAFYAEQKEQLMAELYPELPHMVDGYEPRPGDIIFFDWEQDGLTDHVGFVHSFEEHEFTRALRDEETGEALLDPETGEPVTEIYTVRYVKTIEGNSSDRVKYCTYDMESRVIKGYGQLPENPDEEMAYTAVAPDGVSVVLKARKSVLPVDLSEIPNVYLEVTLPESTEASLLVEEATNLTTDTPEGSVSGTEVRTVVYDIRLMHNGQEIQPTGFVSVSFSNLPGEAGTAEVFHVDETASAVTQMETGLTEQGDLSFDTDHFSLYGISYTVDFDYNGSAFSIRGYDSIWLSELFERLEIHLSTSDVTSVVFSDPSLLNVERRVNEGKTDYLLTSLLPFSTSESLVVTLANGESFTMDVTDSQSAKSLHYGLIAEFVDTNGTVLSTTRPASGNYDSNNYVNIPMPVGAVSGDTITPDQDITNIFYFNGLSGNFAIRPLVPFDGTFTFTVRGSNGQVKGQYRYYLEEATHVNIMESSTHLSDILVNQVSPNLSTANITITGAAATTNMFTLQETTSGGKLDYAITPYAISSVPVDLTVNYTSGGASRTLTLKVINLIEEPLAAQYSTDGGATWLPDASVGGVTLRTAIANAVSTVPGQGKVRLIRDTLLTDMILIPSGNLEIDGQGHTITRGYYSVGEYEAMLNYGDASSVSNSTTIALKNLIIDGASNYGLRGGAISIRTQNIDLTNIQVHHVNLTGTHTMDAYSATTANSLYGGMLPSAANLVGQNIRVATAVFTQNTIDIGEFYSGKDPKVGAVGLNIALTSASGNVELTGGTQVTNNNVVVRASAAGDRPVTLTSVGLYIDAIGGSNVSIHDDVVISGNRVEASAVGSVNYNVIGAAVNGSVTLGGKVFIADNSRRDLMATGIVLNKALTNDSSIGIYTTVSQHSDTRFGTTSSLTAPTENSQTLYGVEHFFADTNAALFPEIRTDGHLWWVGARALTIYKDLKDKDGNTVADYRTATLSAETRLTEQPDFPENGARVMMTLPSGTNVTVQSRSTQAGGKFYQVTYTSGTDTYNGFLPEAALTLNPNLKFFEFKAQLSDEESAPKMWLTGDGFYGYMLTGVNNSEAVFEVAAGGSLALPVYAGHNVDITEDLAEHTYSVFGSSGVTLINDGRGKVSLVMPESEASITWQNKETPTVRIRKIDEDTLEPLQGARFRVYYVGTNDQRYYLCENASNAELSWEPNKDFAYGYVAVKYFETDTNGEFSISGHAFAVDRTYWIEEVKAPAGDYKILPDKSITLLSGVFTSDMPVYDTGRFWVTGFEFTNYQGYDLTIQKQIDTERATAVLLYGGSSQFRSTPNGSSIIDLDPLHEVHIGDTVTLVRRYQIGTLNYYYAGHTANGQTFYGWLPESVLGDVVFSAYDFTLRLTDKNGNPITLPSAAERGYVAGEGYVNFTLGPGGFITFDHIRANSVLSLSEAAKDGYFMDYATRTSGTSPEEDYYMDSDFTLTAPTTIKVVNAKGATLTVNNQVISGTPVNQNATTRGVVNVRSWPNASKGVRLAQLPNSTAVTIVARSEDDLWYRVTYDNGAGLAGEGWVLKGQLNHSVKTADFNTFEAEFKNADDTPFPLREDSEYYVTGADGNIAKFYLLNGGNLRVDVPETAKVSVTEIPKAGYTTMVLTYPFTTSVAHATNNYSFTMGLKDVSARFTNLADPIQTERDVIFSTIIDYGDTTNSSVHTAEAPDWSRSLRQSIFHDQALWVNYGELGWNNSTLIPIVWPSDYYGGVNEILVSDPDNIVVYRGPDNDEWYLRVISPFDGIEWISFNDNILDYGTNKFWIRNMFHIYVDSGKRINLEQKNTSGIGYGQYYLSELLLEQVSQYIDTERIQTVEVSIENGSDNYLSVTPSVNTERGSRNYGRRDFLVRALQPSWDRADIGTDHVQMKIIYKNGKTLTLDVINKSENSSVRYTTNGSSWSSAANLHAAYNAIEQATTKASSSAGRCIIELQSDAYLNEPLYIDRSLTIRSASGSNYTIYKQFSSNGSNAPMIGTNDVSSTSPRVGEIVIDNVNFSNTPVRTDDENEYDNIRWGNLGPALYLAANRVTLSGSIVFGYNNANSNSSGFILTYAGNPNKAVAPGSKYHNGSPDLVYINADQKVTINGSASRGIDIEGNNGMVNSFNRSKEDGRFGQLLRIDYTGSASDGVTVNNLDVISNQRYRSLGEFQYLYNAITNYDYKDGGTNPRVFEEHKLSYIYPLVDIRLSGGNAVLTNVHVNSNDLTGEVRSYNFSGSSVSYSFTEFDSTGAKDDYGFLYVKAENAASNVTIRNSSVNYNTQQIYSADRQFPVSNGLMLVNPAVQSRSDGVFTLDSVSVLGNRYTRKNGSFSLPDMRTRLLEAGNSALVGLGSSVYVRGNADLRGTTTIGTQNSYGMFVDKNEGQNTNHQITLRDTITIANQMARYNLWIGDANENAIRQEGQLSSPSTIGIRLGTRDEVAGIQFAATNASAASSAYSNIYDVYFADTNLRLKARRLSDNNLYWYADDQILIKKVNSSGELLANAGFYIQRTTDGALLVGNGTTSNPYRWLLGRGDIYYTGSDGTLKLKGLELQAGQYRLSEVVYPDGYYYPATSLTFSADSAAAITYVQGMTLEDDTSSAKKLIYNPSLSRAQRAAVTGSMGNAEQLNPYQFNAAYYANQNSSTGNYSTGYTYYRRYAYGLAEWTDITTGKLRLGLAVSNDFDGFGAPGVMRLPLQSGIVPDLSTLQVWYVPEVRGSWGISNPSAIQYTGEYYFAGSEAPYAPNAMEMDKSQLTVTKDGDILYIAFTLDQTEPPAGYSGYFVQFDATWDTVTGSTSTSSSWKNVYSTTPTFYRAIPSTSNADLTRLYSLSEYRTYMKNAYGNDAKAMYNFHAAATGSGIIPVQNFPTPRLARLSDYTDKYLRIVDRAATDFYVTKTVLGYDSARQNATVNAQTQMLQHPVSGATSLRTLAAASSIMITGQYGSYYQVKYNTTYGWVPKSSVTTSMTNADFFPFEVNFSWADPETGYNYRVEAYPAGAGAVWGGAVNASYATVRAKAAPGYQLDSFEMSTDGGQYFTRIGKEQYGATGEYWTEVEMATNTIVRAVFVPTGTAQSITYHTVNIEATTGGYAYGSGIYENGDLFSVNAVPRTGYRFSRWVNALTGAVVSTSANYGARISGSDLVLRAEFVAAAAYVPPVNQGYTVSGNKATFYLANGGRMKFPAVNHRTRITVTEGANSSYDAVYYRAQTLNSSLAVSNSGTRTFSNTATLVHSAAVTDQVAFFNGKYATVRIEKTDETGSTRLAGASFKIMDEEGRYLQVNGTEASFVGGEKAGTLFTVGSNGLLELPVKLITGNYKLIEIDAPQGYVMRDGIAVSDFSIGSDGTITGSSDSREVTSLQVDYSLTRSERPVPKGSVTATNPYQWNYGYVGYYSTGESMGAMAEWTDIQNGKMRLSFGQYPYNTNYVNYAPGKHEITFLEGVVPDISTIRAYAYAGAGVFSENYFTNASHALASRYQSTYPYVNGGIDITSSLRIYYDSSSRLLHVSFADSRLTNEFGVVLTLEASTNNTGEFTPVTYLGLRYVNADYWQSEANRAVHPTKVGTVWTSWRNATYQPKLIRNYITTGTNNNGVSTVTIGGNTYLRVRNKQTPVIRLTKTSDLDANTFIPGAQFTIEQAETGQYLQSDGKTLGNSPYVFTADTNGRVVLPAGLYDGTYVVREQNAPSGYAKETTPYVFSVGGTVSTKTIVVTNEGRYLRKADGGTAGLSSGFASTNAHQYNMSYGSHVYYSEYDYYAAPGDFQNVFGNKVALTAEWTNIYTGEFEYRFYAEAGTSGGDTYGASVVGFYGGQITRDDLTSVEAYYVPHSNANTRAILGDEGYIAYFEANKTPVTGYTVDYQLNGNVNQDHVTLGSFTSLRSSCPEGYDIMVVVRGKIAEDKYYATGAPLNSVVEGYSDIRRYRPASAFWTLYSSTDVSNSRVPVSYAEMPYRWNNYQAAQRYLMSNDGFFGDRSFLATVLPGRGVNDLTRVFSNDVSEMVGGQYVFRMMNQPSSKIYKVDKDTKTAITNDTTARFRLAASLVAANANAYYTESGNGKLVYYTTDGTWATKADIDAGLKTAAEFSLNADGTVAGLPRMIPRPDTIGGGTGISGSSDTYILEEIVAPLGYAIPYDYRFAVRLGYSHGAPRPGASVFTSGGLGHQANLEAVTLPESGNQISMYAMGNTIPRYIELQKKDDEGNLLPTAEFKIERVDSASNASTWLQVIGGRPEWKATAAEVDPITLDSVTAKHLLPALPDGEYYIHETKVPDTFAEGGPWHLWIIDGVPYGTYLKPLESEAYYAETGNTSGNSHTPLGFAQNRLNRYQWNFMDADYLTYFGQRSGSSVEWGWKPAQLKSISASNRTNNVLGTVGENKVYTYPDEENGILTGKMSLVFWLRGDTFGSINANVPAFLQAKLSSYVDVVSVEALRIKNDPDVLSYVGEGSTYGTILDTVGTPTTNPQTFEAFAKWFMQSANHDVMDKAVWDVDENNVLTVGLYTDTPFVESSSSTSEMRHDIAIIVRGIWGRTTPDNQQSVFESATAKYTSGATVGWSNTYRTGTEAQQKAALKTSFANFTATQTTNWVPFTTGMNVLARVPDRFDTPQLISYNTGIPGADGFLIENSREFNVNIYKIDATAHKAGKDGTDILITTADAEFTIYMTGTGGEKLYYCNDGSWSVAEGASEGNRAIIKTTREGKLDLPRLSPGDYRLEEVTAPGAYRKPFDKFNFKVLNTGAVTTDGSLSDKPLESFTDPTDSTKLALGVPNNQMEAIVVHKNDYATGEPVAGAKFIVSRMQDGNELFYARNTSTGMMDWLFKETIEAAGSTWEYYEYTSTAAGLVVIPAPVTRTTYYQVYEVSAPEGYYFREEDKAQISIAPPVQTIHVYMDSATASDTSMLEYAHVPSANGHMHQYTGRQGSYNSSVSNETHREDSSYPYQFVATTARWTDLDKGKFELVFIVRGANADGTTESAIPAINGVTSTTNQNSNNHANGPRELMAYLQADLNPNLTVNSVKIYHQHYAQDEALGSSGFNTRNLNAIINGGAITVGNVTRNTIGFVGYRNIDTSGNGWGDYQFPCRYQLNGNRLTVAAYPLDNNGNVYWWRDNTDKGNKRQDYQVVIEGTYNGFTDSVGDANGFVDMYSRLVVKYCYAKEGSRTYKVTKPVAGQGELTFDFYTDAYGSGTYNTNGEWWPTDMNDGKLDDHDLEYYFAQFDASQDDANHVRNRSWQNRKDGITVDPNKLARVMDVSQEGVSLQAHVNKSNLRKNSFEVLKTGTDENNNLEVLGGATFELFKVTDLSVSPWVVNLSAAYSTTTAANGKASFPAEMDNGTYIMRETVAPTGYGLSPLEWVVLMNNGQVVISQRYLPAGVEADPHWSFDGKEFNLIDDRAKSSYDLKVAKQVIGMSTAGQTATVRPSSGGSSAPIVTLPSSSGTLVRNADAASTVVVWARYLDENQKTWYRVSQVYQNVEYAGWMEADNLQTSYNAFFMITVSVVQEDGVTPVALESGRGYIVSGANSNIATMELANGGMLTIPELPIGAIATITESEASASGYKVLMKEGRANLAEGRTVTNIILSADREITVVNNPGIELPMTGGIGTHLLTFSGAFLVLLSAGWLAVWWRRRWERRLTN